MDSKIIKQLREDIENNRIVFDIDKELITKESNKIKLSHLGYLPFCPYGLRKRPKR